MNREPVHFTIYEAWVALYPSSLDDQVIGTEVFLGDCFERVDLTRSYTTRPRPFHGRRHQENYNEDETHTIDLANPLQVGVNDEVKWLERFGRYIAVVVWHDEERGVWLKRTYFGVTDAGEQIGGEVVAGMQMSFKAERVALTTGRVLTIVPESQYPTVDHVGVTRTSLYGCDGGAFIALPTFDAAKGQIVSASGLLSFYVEGVLAMQVTPADFKVNELVGLGSFYDTPAGKLEFMINGTRVATLTKAGVFAAPDFEELLSAPADLTDIELRLAPSNAWSASIRNGVTSALNFSEYLVP